jgi:D-beta-D-heptose 7-phosphate kinase / D-beta-D-heptose 1-phosphate adenosyltransferase
MAPTKPAEEGASARASSKVVELDSLIARLRQWRAAGDRIVFTNGCFDVLHIGHVTLLEGCHRFGDKVIVGLNSDASVKKLKGRGRPVFSERERALMVAALEATDAIVIFSEDTPIELIRRIRPDVVVKGGDYVPSVVVGFDDVKEWGGRVEIIRMVDGFSTTRILQKLARLVTA